MDVGFIGVGKIGAPIACQIAIGGHNVTAFDHRPDAAKKLAARGIRYAANIDHLINSSEVICTCLPGPTELESLMFSKEGGEVAARMRPGTLYIDLTTSSPELARRIHNVLQAREIMSVDSPVSGGVEGAASGDLAAIVGGDAIAFERARPILETAAQRVLHVGPPGSGQICKIVHNSAMFCAEMALAECMTAGVAADVKAETLFEALQACAMGGGLSRNVRLPATWLSGDFESRFDLSAAYKDMSLAAELGASLGVPLPSVAACRDRMAEALSRGWSGKDSSIMHKLQEERAGVQVRFR